MRICIVTPPVEFAAKERNTRQGTPYICIGHFSLGSTEPAHKTSDKTSSNCFTLTLPTFVATTHHIQSLRKRIILLSLIQNANFNFPNEDIVCFSAFQWCHHMVPSTISMYIPHIRPMTGICNNEITRRESRK